MAGGKRPAVAKLPKVSKRPGLGKDPELAKHNPLVWGFQWLDRKGPWGWGKLAPQHVVGLHRELVRLEGEPLHELERRKDVKQIPVVEVVRDAQERLKAIGLEEADTLWELRLNIARQRVWGLVEQSTFFLLWWDPDHTVCRAPPKTARRRK